MIRLQAMTLGDCDIIFREFENESKIVSNTEAEGVTLGEGNEDSFD